MKEKYGCKLCAFYHQIELNYKQLEELIYKNLIKKFFILTHIDLSKYEFDEDSFEEDQLSVINNKDILVKSILLRSVENIKHELPSLCIYKNEIQYPAIKHY